VATVYANASATRPATNNGDDMDEAQLREAVGMPDAPLDDVLAAVREKFGTAGGNDPSGTDAGDGDANETPGDGEGDAPAGDAPVSEGEPVAAGLVSTIETARLERLEASAAEGVEARKLLAAQHRDKVLAKHLGRGAITREAAAAWRDEFDKNPATTERLLETLASGKVPVDGEYGIGTEPGAGNAGAHTPEAHAARMAMHGVTRETAAPGTSNIPTDTKGA
jgi:hypothetical protein